jgi:hypothetical protein
MLYKLGNEKNNIKEERNPPRRAITTQRFSIGQFSGLGKNAATPINNFELGSPNRINLVTEKFSAGASVLPV